MAIDLIHYDEKKLRTKVFADMPMIRVYRNGKFYIYKQLLKKLACKVGDRVLFSYQVKTNEWYISRSKSEGLELKDAGSYNSLSIVTSTILRKEILETQQIFNNHKDSFYMCVSASPHITQGGNVYHKIDILL
ncbi:MAG: hypothetical protein IT265_07115 [Saprospiraceae bacterium]|nr:hypothetical protein [Saprospiraceae bacterium]